MMNTPRSQAAQRASYKQAQGKRGTSAALGTDAPRI